MTDMTPQEMVDELVKNVVTHGTGFTKLTRDEQGNLVTSIVPIEDYMYINGKPEWVGLTADEVDVGLVRSNHAFQMAGAWRDGVEWASKQLKEKNT